VIATNGEEALSKAISHLEPIHLLLTDVIMPGMNGRCSMRKSRSATPSSR
jgi:YesN/AraC family two-component response regulator